jgi:hypothetical protein
MNVGLAPIEKDARAGFPTYSTLEFECGKSPAPSVLPANVAATMPKLTIDLQDGFSGDEVIVRVNGQEVARPAGVKTKRMLGLAQSLDVSVPAGPVSLEIDLPAKQIRGTRVVHHSHIGVSLAGTDVQFIEADKPFGYG